MPERSYGEIEGYPRGSQFASRDELAAAGVHRPPQGGICGGQDGAESIVLSGGYEDDDRGAEIIYTGHGGWDNRAKKQVADQALTHGNAGLARSSVEGHPVRVIRGAGRRRERSPHAPDRGLRYDGLFRVAEFWHDTRDGFRVWRFRLVADDWPDVIEPAERDTKASGPAARRSSTTQRIVRNTETAQRVKEIHDHTCQMCGLRISTPGGFYAEAAHIRGLGRPHNGPDVADNILCLCPNHHVMFDTGAIYINEIWVVCDTATHEQLGELRRNHRRHPISRVYVEYHRAHHVP